MYSRVFSASCLGIKAFVVEIETHIEKAAVNFFMVGLPDAAVKEAQQRVISALKNSKLPFPVQRITVNLAPADIRKEGSGFDLPIALGILAAQNEIPPESLESTIALGELALEGFLRPIHGALSIAMEARENGFKKIILPKLNSDEAALVEGIDVIPIESLNEVAGYLNETIKIEPRKVDVREIFDKNQGNYHLNLSDVMGQENVKRALEVSAAGGHNMLMIGPPGSGKTMLAKRIPTILPPLTVEESLETTKIHSIAGILPPGEALVTVRPFRSPHHTISDAALVGGGVSKIKPGEISLSHHGVLFLDELPEFARNVLEVLRQPLEEKQINISRTKMTIEYPANFMLVCSMNPCPCGNWGNPQKDCKCNSTQIQRYLSRISGPLLDRIDIHVEVPAVKYQEISSNRTGEPSESVRERVIKCRTIQAERFRKSKGIFKNADMNTRAIKKYCELDQSCQDLMKMAMNKIGISARGYDRILKVARTIADLSECENIKSEHISEAIQYRSLDRQYWK